MMPRVLHKLTPKTVAAARAPGRLSDGGGLYLSVSEDGRKRWVFLYALSGRRREMGLGSAGPGGVSLANARAAAAEARQAVSKRVDPIEAKQAAQAASRARPAEVPTFGEVGDAYVETMRPSWSNKRHAEHWEKTVRVQAALIRALPINEIDTEAVLSVLQPIWQTTPQTAQRLRGRVEAILDAAKTRGLRSGENPARWRGHLAHLLPKRPMGTQTHFRAMPYSQIPVFMGRLRAQNDIPARLLEFVILTASRSAEGRGARWDEINTKERLWIIPPTRMKSGKEHRVPLCDRALEILEFMATLRHGDLIFPNSKNKPRADVVLGRVLKGLGVAEVATTHGMRSSFRDWAAERTNFPNEVCEQALAHIVSNQVEAAYRRGSLLQKRRELMGVWGSYCAGGAEIVPMIRAVS